MSSFIDLYAKGKSLGRFDLPSEVTGEGKGVFRLQKSVKGGGNGIVFEAKPLRGVKKIEGRCAIKLLRQQEDACIDRFKNELRIIRMLDHRQISRCYDAGDIDLGSGYMVPWIAMQLGDVNLREDVQKEGPLPPESLLNVVTQMCDAIDQPSLERNHSPRY